MINLARSSRLRRDVSFIEVLESRIAPATFNLPVGNGPYTLERAVSDSHIHITDGTGAEIFDLNLTTGDDLTITSTGGDDLNIEQTVSGPVTFTGTLDVNIAGAIHVNGDVIAATALRFTSNATITTGGVLTSALALFSAANSVSILGGIANVNGSVTINADNDNDGTGTFTNSAGSNNLQITGALASATISITAADMTLASALVAGANGLVILTASAGRNVDLGTDTAGRLGLTNSELNHVVADTLQIGTGTLANTDITGVISPTGYRVLSVYQGSFQPGSGLDLQFTSSTNFEKLQVAISYGGLANATLNATAVGGFVPKRSDSFTIIDVTSNGGVTGGFISLPESSIVSIGGVAKSIAYADGGHDVVLQAVATLRGMFSSGQLQVNDLAAGINHLTITNSGTGNYLLTALDEVFTDPLGALGSSLSNGGRTLVVPIASIGSGFLISLGAGSDTLTLDFGGGIVIPLGDINYDAGGPSDFDQLEFIGGSHGLVAFNYTAGDAGSITSSTYGAVTYSNLESILHGGSSITTTFNLLNSVQNLVFLGDDGMTSNGLSQLTESSSNITPTEFKNPSVMVNLRPATPSDFLFVAALPDLTAGLVLGTPSNQFAEINLSGAITLGPAKSLIGYSTGDINVTGQLAVTASGTLELNAARSLSATASASFSAVDGSILLTSVGTAPGNYAGIFMLGSVFTSGSGSIMLTGSGGHSGQNNHGIALSGSLTTTGTGSIVLEGHGGLGGDDFNHGLSLIGGTITAGTGGARLSGTAGTSAGGSLGIDLGATVVSGGSLILETDAGLFFEAVASVNAGGNLVHLRPISAAVLISVGGAAQAAGFNIPDAVIDAISAGLIQIGDVTSGAISLLGAISSTKDLAFSTGGNFSGLADLTLSPGKALSAQVGGSINLSGVVTAPATSTFAVGGNLVLTNPSNDFALVSVISSTDTSLTDGDGFTLAQVNFLGTLGVNSAGPITQTGPLIGGALLKLGSGTLTLSQANPLTGTTISNGTILFSAVGAFGTGTITLGDASTGNNDVGLFATQGSGTALPNDIVVPSLGGASVASIGSRNFASPGTILYGGTLSLGRATILSTSGTSVVAFTNVLSGNVGTLTVEGSGVASLRENNTFIGNLQVVGSATLEIRSESDVIPDATNIDLAQNAFLSLAKTGYEFINHLTGTGTVTTSANAPGPQQRLGIGAMGGAFTFDGTIQENSAAPLSLLKVGTGNATLTGELTFTGTTLIATGTLSLSNPDLENPLATSTSIDINNSARLNVMGLTNPAHPQMLMIAPGQILLGSGTIDGGLGGFGTIMPGTATIVGILTINGSFQPGGQIQYNVNAPYTTAGGDYDQIIVNFGTVDLSAGGFSLVGGATFPNAGTTVKLISNTGASATVPGVLPPEGGVVSFGQAVFTVGYHGGDGNDFVITSLTGLQSLSASLSAGTLTVSDTNAAGRANYLTVTMTGANFVITDQVEMFISAPAGGTLSNGNHTLTIPVTTARSVNLASGAGDDTLTVDFSGGGRLGTNGLFFDGGGGSDRLILQGAGQGAVVFLYQAQPGFGTVTSSNFGTVRFNQIESAAELGTATNLVFKIGAPSNTMTLADDGTTGNGLSQLSSTGFIPTDFAEPSGTLAIGNGGPNDTMFVGSLPDFHAGLTVGLEERPFQSIDLLDSFATAGQLSLFVNVFSLSAAHSLSASSGVLTIGSGSINGSIDGGLGLHKVSDQQGIPLFLNSANAFTGDTLAEGPIILGNSLAVQNSTVDIRSSFAVQFLAGGAYVFGGLAGPGSLPITAGGSPVDLSVGQNNASTTYSGSLIGAGSLTKIGTGRLTLTGANDQLHTQIAEGVLLVGSDRALGPVSSLLQGSGGTLQAIATFSIARPITLDATTATTFQASAGKTLTLSGVITGMGDLKIGPTGVVKITGQSNLLGGSVELNNSQPVVFNGVAVSTPGAKGSIVITPGMTMGMIESINVTGVESALSIVVKAPNDGSTVMVGSIISTDNTPIKKISLGDRVVLGNGLADLVPDLVVNGKLGSLSLGDVNANTIITLGKGLAYADTYKNLPNLTFTGVLGAGVVIDVTGIDGTAGNLPGALGGGGLGKVVFSTAANPSTIKTTQGIKSITVKAGDFNSSVQVDRDHVGALNVASVGKVSIPNGQWVGAGMEVEGVVAKFLTAGLAQGTQIAAGAFGAVVIKGNYNGSIVATFDSAVTTTVKGKVKTIATGDIASVTVNGNFGGVINGDGKVGNITVAGSGQFTGTVRGGSIGNLTALSFTGGTYDDDGELIAGSVRHTITASGSIGNLTASGSNLRDYIIAAGTDLGRDAVFGGVAEDTFISYLTSLTGVKTAVQIGNVTVKGTVTGTTIAAGIRPGASGVYGGGDDAVATAGGGTVKAKIGAIKFEAATAVGSMGFAPGELLDVSNAFESQVMTSVQFGKSKTADKLASAFPGNRYVVDAGGSSIIIRLII